MKLNIHALKIALLFSIITIGLAALPGAALCAETPAAPKIAAIESVSANGDGSAAELAIKLTSPATYTSYKVASPLRLVIDFSQVTEGSVTAPVIINKGNFKTVTAHRFNTDAGILTRLEIEIVNDSEAVISASPASAGVLTVSFPELALISPKTAESGIAAGNDNQVASTASAVDASFKTLTGITVSNNIIKLAVDGDVSDFKTFRLNKPERYVVDLLNVKSGLASKLLQLNASGVASARIGHYPDKVRVVLDSINGTFPEAMAAKSSSGVDIKLDVKTLDENANTKLTATRIEKKDADQPTPVEQVKPERAASAVVSTPVKAVGAPSVEMVDFQVIGDVSRVSVKVNGSASAEPPVKSPGYVTLTIKKAQLPKHLQRSIETRSFVSPVLRITPLTVKSKFGSDVKIRIATRVEAAFDFRSEGDMLYVDFKHPEGLSGDKLVVEAAEQKVRAAQQNKSSDNVDNISAELAPVSETSTSGRVYKGRKVTLEFADAEVRKIFQLLSEVSNKNFVLGDDVTGNISLKLVNVPWDQALDIILETKNLDKREDGNIVLIKGKGKFKSQAEEELEIKKLAAKSIELKTETFSVNYADLAAIASQFEKLKTSDRGQISADTRTSKIIVKDTPQALNDMRSLLKQLDLPEKQVMIEARIVEAQNTFTQSIGINWGVHATDGDSGNFMNINKLDSAFGGLTSAPPAAVTGGVAGGGTGSAAGSNVGITFGTIASTVNISMRLSAAAAAGMIKIVSTPKISTLNNKSAKITQGQQIPYTSSTSDKVETKFIEAALSLEVTPHINANGTISMKIDAKNDSPGTGNPPPINKKQATTEMLLRDGETTVIGGIFVSNEVEGDEGVPYLMDIPFLGNLFKTKTTQKSKSELLIFITPRILSPNI